jgi:hypothetical protein
MEIEDLKQIWKQENLKIEERMRLNEKLLLNLQKEKSIDSFEKHLTVAIWGKNLAIVYFVISMLLSGLVFNRIELCIPGFIGGFLMLWSFYSHLSIHRPDYNRMSVIELQKFIYKFRIHMDNSKKNDGAIVIIWFITLYPIYLHFGFKKELYQEPQLLLWSAIFLIILIPLFFAINYKMYQKIDVKLKESEERLNEIKMVEEEQ